MLRHEPPLYFDIFGRGGPSRPSPPPVPPIHSENMTVLGVAPGVPIRATLRMDDTHVYTAERDPNFPQIGRMRFFVTHQVNGGWLHVEADGYVPYDARIVTGAGDHELPSVTLTLAFSGRRGLVRHAGKAVLDDDGFFHPLGLTFFWAMQGWKRDRDRFKANVQWLKPYRFDYVRILCEVAWAPPLEIDPTKPDWADHAQVLAEVIDYFYENGLRVEPTIIGKGTGVNRLRLTESIADVIADGRTHKILDVECANEYDVGGGAPDIPEMEAMARILRARTPNLVALSSPGDWTELEFAAKRAGCQAFTVHPDRGTGDNRWRQVRQGYDFKNVGLVVLSNEPAGPGSSVATQTDPLQLAMMRAVGVMCGGAGFVLHTGTGVYGDGKPHPHAGPRPANFWEIANIDAIIRALRDVDSLLPQEVENWRVANTQWTSPLPVAPLQPNAHWEGSQPSGVNKAYSALAADGRVIQMPCGCKPQTRMVPSYPLTDVTVYDPLTRTPVAGLEKLTATPGEFINLPARSDSMAAYIIHARRA